MPSYANFEQLKPELMVFLYFENNLTLIKKELMKLSAIIEQGDDGWLAG